MSRGPYRAEQALDTALPWARHNLVGWSIAVIVAGVIAIAIPIVALESSGTLASIVGPRTGPTLFSTLLAVIPALLTVAGVLVARGRKIPVAPLLVGAIAPFVVSAVQSTRLAAPLPDFLKLESSEDTVRTAADAFARIEANDLQGAIGTAAACLVVAVAAIGALGTVDRERASAAPGPVWTTLLIGAGWFVIGFGVRVAFRPQFGALVFLATSLVAPLVAIVLAALATWMIRILDKSGDAQEVASTLVCLAVASVASIFLVLALDRASIAAISGIALRDAAKAMTPEQRFTLVAPLVEARAAHSWAAIVDLVGAIAVFAVPLQSAYFALHPSWMKHVRAALPMLGMAGSVIVIFAGALFIETSVVRATRHSVVIVDPAPLPAERAIQIPKVHRAGPPRDASSRRVVVAPGQAAIPTLSNVDLVVDGRMTFAELMRPATRSTQPSDVFSFVAQPVERPNVEALGDLAAFIGPFERRIPAMVAVANARPPLSGLTVTLGEAPFVTVTSATQSIQLSIAGDETHRTDELAQLALPSHCYVELHARPSDPMDRVIVVAASLRSDLVEMGILPDAMPIHLVIPPEPRPVRPPAWPRTR